jgi:hypothetical protein
MRIAILDDEPEKVRHIADIFSELGFEAKIFEPDLFDTPESFASRVMEFNPDVIYADYSLHGEFKGYDVLRALGGKFWSPGNPNPRVVSTSSRPHGAMPTLAGAHYPHKDELPEPRFKGMLVALFKRQLELVVGPTAQPTFS